jgi:hypothetical protein
VSGSCSTNIRNVVGGKGPFVKSRCRLKKGINWILKEQTVRMSTDSSCSGHRRVAGSCEIGEYLGSTREEFLD